MIDSLKELEENCDKWNDLWKRSTTTNPIAQAELVALYTRFYGFEEHFQAAIVESDGRWLAAIPLVTATKYRLLKVANFPNENHLYSIQFLLDPSFEPLETVQQLISGIRKLPMHLFWLEGIRLGNTEWQHFRNGLRLSGIPYAEQVCRETAIVTLGKPIDELEPHWNKKQVADIKRRQKKLGELGTIEVVKCTQEKDVVDAVPVCFDIENKGWKGDNNSSGKKKGHEPFFTEKARLLAQKNQMLIYGLTLDSKWIAFQYCYTGKDTCYVLKLSYDPEFRQYGAGQILNYLVFQDLCKNSDISLYDYIGDIMDYQKIWNPVVVQKNQLVFPMNSLLGKTAFSAYRFLKSTPPQSGPEISELES